MKQKIKLGDKVKDMVTGYTGIAVARTEFLNGCVQYCVAKKLKVGENLPTEEPSIDERCLKVVQKKVVVSKEYENEDDDDYDDDDENGGPVRFVKGMRGY